MPNVANLTIGITANTSGLVGGLSSAQVSVSQFSSGINAAGVALGNLASVGIQKALDGLRSLVGAMGDSITAAGELETQMAKFNTVFGSQADSTRTWAAQFAQSLGRAKSEFVPFLAAIQDTLVPLGMSRDAAAGMSKQVVQLAADLAASENIPMTEAIERLQGALVGNTENLRKFGVVALETQVKQKLLEMGFRGNATQASALQKAMAIWAITVEGTADAQGAAARNAGLWSGQMTQLNSAILDAKLAIGDALLPLVKELMPFVTSLIRDAGAAMAGFVERSKGAAGELKDGLIRGLEFVRQIVPGLVGLMDIFISRWQFLGSVGLVAVGGLTWALGKLQRAIALITNKPLDIKLDQIGADMIQAGVSGIGGSFTRFFDALTGKTQDAVRGAIDAAAEALKGAGDYAAEKLTIPPLPGLDTSAVSQATDEMRDIADKWQRIGESLTESTRTPLEQLRMSIDEATEAFQRGVIDGVTYWRVVDQIRDKFVAAGEASRQLEQGVGAVTQGTTAAFSAIQKAIRAADVQAAEAADRAKADAAIREAQRASIARLDGTSGGQPAAMMSQSEVVKKMQDNQRLLNQQLAQQKAQLDELRELNRKTSRPIVLREVGI